MGLVIERMQDGKKFNARYSPDKRGFISSPTVLVSENGKEYVVPAAAMDNPSLIPVLNTIEAARRQGTLGSFDFNAVYRQNTPVPGFVSGGPTGDIPSFNTTEAQVHVRHLEDRALVHLLHKRGQELLQFIQGRGLQYVLDRHTAPSSAEGGLLLYEGAGQGLFADFFRQGLGDLHLRAFPFLDIA